MTSTRNNGKATRGQWFLVIAALLSILSLAGIGIHALMASAASDAHHSGPSHSSSWNEGNDYASKYLYTIHKDGADEGCFWAFDAKVGGHASNYSGNGDEWQAGCVAFITQ